MIADDDKDAAAMAAQRAMDGRDLVAGGLAIEDAARVAMTTPEAIRAIGGRASPLPSPASIRAQSEAIRRGWVAVSDE